MRISVIIPTYNRDHLLGLLLPDIVKQSVKPMQVIVVDGNPDSRKVIDRVRSLSTELTFPITYIPSTHANAPFQRYLGSMCLGDSDLCLFVDDDIRINHANTIEYLSNPFQWQHEIVAGISPVINFPNRAVQNSKHNLLQNFFVSKGKEPGELTPVGNRILPEDSNEEFVEVKWLRGGVMLYDIEFLKKVIYQEDVFAMAEKGYGLGVDDTYLSRCIGMYGKLLLANNVTVDHPDNDASKVYSANSQKKAYAVAYSRRFQNDHYRVTRPPTVGDRLYLLKSYLGNNLLNVIHLIRKPNQQQFAHFLGYLQGSLRGIFQKPTAKNLTPDIDWQADADEALQKAIVIQ